MDETILFDLANKVMPYGKYKGLKLYQLPEPYVFWLHEHGFPSGRLGILLATLYEIKLNGLEHLIRPLETHG